MAISLGHFLGGATEGAVGGYAIAQNAKAERIKNEIEQLKALNEDKKLKMQEAKADQEMKAKDFEFTFNNFDRFMEGANKLVNPAQRQKMLQSAPSMPFFQKATPDNQALMSAILNSPDSGDIQKILKTGLAAAQKNDINGISQSFIELNSRLGETENPQVKSALNTLGSILGGHLIPPKKTETTITMPGESPKIETGTKKLAEQKILEKTLSLKDVDKAIENFDADSLGYLGQVEKIYLTIKDNMKGIVDKIPVIRDIPFLNFSPENKKTLEAYGNSWGALQKVANDYLYEMSGKAIPLKEVARYKNVAPILFSGPEGLTKNPSPTEAARQIKAFRETIQEDLNIYKKAYMEGRLMFDQDGYLIGFSDKPSPKWKTLNVPGPDQLPPAGDVAEGPDPTGGLGKIAIEIKRNNPSLSDEQVKALALEQVNQNGTIQY